MCAARLRHFESLRHAIDRDHPFGAKHERAANRELTDRSAAPDRDGVAFLNIAILGGHVAGRKDIGEKEHLLVAERFGDFHGADIRKRYAHVFGLPAGVAAEQMREAEEAGRGVTPQGCGHLRILIRTFAGRKERALAKETFAARHRECNDDAITDDAILHAASNLDDLTDELVAEDVSRFHRRNEPVVEMQIGAANRGKGYLDDCIA